MPLIFLHFFNKLVIKSLYKLFSMESGISYFLRDIFGCNKCINCMRNLFCNLKNTNILSITPCSAAKTIHHAAKL